MRPLYKTLIPFCVLILALPGCALHKSQVSEPLVTMPPVFIEADTTEGQESAAIGKWWERFNDQTLNTLMEEMLANNLDIAQAYARLAQLEATARKSNAARFPFLDGNLEGDRNQQQSFLQETQGTNYSFSVAAGYEVDLWQKLKSQSKAAKLEAVASREDIKALYISLSAQFADLYFTAVEQRAQLDLADKIIATLTDSLVRVERRYRAGIAQPLDVYQARQNLMEAKERRPTFEATLATTTHAIALLLGRFPEDEIAGSASVLPEVPAQLPAGLPVQLLTRRPDIEAVFLRLSAKDARIAAAIADRLPQVNLLGNYGKAHSEFGDLTSTGIVWKIMADLSMPLIDFGRRRAEVDRTRAVFEEDLALYKQTVIKAVQEVEDALAKKQATVKRIDFLSERTVATEGSMRLSNSNYFEGLADYLPVLVNQQIHFRALVDLLSARRQLVSDHITLMRALGGDWVEDEFQAREKDTQKQG